MSSKHKDAILDILKRSGPLSSASLKIRVQHFLNLTEDDYPKSTYLNHLSQLTDELKIKFKTESNKRIYFIENYTHPISGGKIIENFNGRIQAQPILLPFNLNISESLKLESNPNKCRLNFILYGANFSIEIDSDAVPFNLYIARKMPEEFEQTKIYNKYGKRTIILELNHQKLSSYKNDIRDGHVLFTFNSNIEVNIKDLHATNPCLAASLTKKDYDCTAEELTRYNHTINTDWIKSHALSNEQISLKDKGSMNFHVPIIISLDNDSHILIN